MVVSQIAETYLPSSGTFEWFKFDNPRGITEAELKERTPYYPRGLRDGRGKVQHFRQKGTSADSRDLHARSSHCLAIQGRLPMPPNLASMTNQSVVRFHNTCRIRMIILVPGIRATFTYLGLDPMFCILDSLDLAEAAYDLKTRT